ncbi:Sulfotransferase family protein [Limimonas halophila]|uniref:Sulfotransferase family protein n=2 Tax=Limimonas halophila TaxID=1082479 RepID=A0A1G7RXS4_9PROT|nr:Sulfotransferase family protein [Limimonas halophila]
MKAGTTAVAEALRAHPAAFVCPVKEPHFLADPAWLGPDADARGVHDAREVLKPDGPATLHHARVADPATYAALFAGAAPARAVVDASTSYLHAPGTPAAIAAARPNARILILLREPAERAYAQYLMDRRIGRTRLSFAEALDREPRYLAFSRYAEAVARYLDAFPREQVLIRTREALRADFAGVFGEICRHIAVAPIEPPATPVNTAAAPRWPGLSAALHRSGAKALARRVLPRGVAARIGRALETAPERTGPTAEERALVWSHLAGEVHRLEALTGLDLRHWADTR